MFFDLRFYTVGTSVHRQLDMIYMCNPQFSNAILSQINWNVRNKVICEYLGLCFTCHKKDVDNLEQVDLSLDTILD